ncbi:MAG TPA: nucleotidyltransferase domain-containing protein [Candidatus Anaerobutyricum stercoris]|uniref:Nucleotidyltransferase domain-containing protein n=2 Tax=Clostridia TaxID=186801 RepID=A0A9D2EK17_9FIRM|nr:nucleotidyltransferase domain-containing protein [Clostridiales bacterium]HIZ38672.1 nucleotidyltransferase domain-containing protein [Candidatus Anaerobutyricum stercoris]
MTEVLNYKKGFQKMNDKIFTITDIKALVKPIAEKYNVDEIYLFGSYARNEANQNSDLDFLVFGGRNFKLTMIFSLAEELRAILNKNVDVFEINEINQDSEFYKTIMKERLRVA